MAATAVSARSAQCGEIGGNGRFFFAAQTRFVSRLSVHAGRTDVEGACGQTLSHRSREPVIVMLHPKMPRAGDQTFYLAPFESGMLLHGWCPTGFALGHDQAPRFEHPNICGYS